MESNGGLDLFSQKKNDFWQKNEKVWVTEVNYLSLEKGEEKSTSKENSFKTGFVVWRTEDDSQKRNFFFFY